MAGRPAAARGGSGATYALIAFVVVSVASLGAFIWQLTVNKRLEDEAARAQRSLREIGQPPSYYLEEAKARGSDASAVLSSDFEAIAFLVSGKKEVVRPAIEEQAKTLLARIATEAPRIVNENDTLLTAMQRLTGALTDANTRIAGLTGEVEQLRAEKQTLTEGVQESRTTFEKEVAALKSEVERLNQDKSDQLAQKDQQYAQQVAVHDSLNEEFSRLKAEKQASETQSSIALERLKKQVTDVNEKMAKSKTPFNATDILTKPDAKIVRAIPGSDIVYINLGRRDAIKPGFSFEVFSPEGERGDDFRGKASIEVTFVDERTSECRVLRSNYGRPIVEGDSVVNIAYEPNRKPKFVLRGEFDLDYDGSADAEGIENITAIVRAWGGQVVPELDETVDFVVVGRGPSVPSLSGDVPPSAVVRDQADTKSQEWESFREVIERARTLYIPVINQSQFLYLTGYAGEAVVGAP